MVKEVRTHMPETTTVPPPVTVKTGVTVKTNGDRKNVPFQKGLTVEGAVKAAGLQARWRTKYFVNQKEVRSSEVLKDGDEVTVVPRKGNG